VSLTPGVFLLAACAGIAESARAPASTAAVVARNLRGDRDRDARFITAFTLSLCRNCNEAASAAPLPPAQRWAGMRLR
jgi:hypothetical protein